MRLSITVFGRPAPQGSKERGPAGQMLESSAYLPAWRQAVKIGAYKAYEEYKAYEGLSTEISLPFFRAGTPVYIERCTFYVGPTQCLCEGTLLPLGPPDADKLLRSTFDALGGARRGTARLYADDAQIMDINGVGKRRSGHPDRTGAIIIVSDGKD